MPLPSLPTIPKLPIPGVDTLPFMAKGNSVISQAQGIKAGATTYRAEQLLKQTTGLPYDLDFEDVAAAAEGHAEGLTTFALAQQTTISPAMIATAKGTADFLGKCSAVKDMFPEGMNIDLPAMKFDFLKDLMNCDFFDEIGDALAAAGDDFKAMAAALAGTVQGILSKANDLVNGALSMLADLEALATDMLNSLVETLALFVDEACGNKMDAAGPIYAALNPSFASAKAIVSDIKGQGLSGKDAIKAAKDRVSSTMNFGGQAEAIKARADILKPPAIPAFPG